MSVKKLVGFSCGIAACIVFWNLPLVGIAADGQICLALTLMTVVWWASDAMPPGYSGLALLIGYSVFIDAGTAPPSLIFSLWTTPTAYLIIGGFLIASAVGDSGLGKRLALNYVKRFVKTYKGLVVSCYVLGFLLSLIIPNSFARAFLLMAALKYAIGSVGLDRNSAANVGLAVFAGAVPSCLVFITCDSTLNPIVIGFAGVHVHWLQWAHDMTLPGLLAITLTCCSHLAMLKEPDSFFIDAGKIETGLQELGAFSLTEKKTLFAVALAILLWSTDSIHGVNAGLTAIGIAVLLSSPLIGVLNASSWAQVPLGTLFFLCAAFAIGSVGEATGMNDWIADYLIPSHVSNNPYVFALVALLLCMLMHLAIGSVAATLGVATPAIIRFGAAAGMPPLVSAYIVRTAVSLQWLFPYHHMNLLIGLGEYGGYTEKDVVRMGIRQMPVALAVVLFQVFWWKLAGLV